MTPSLAQISDLAQILGAIAVVVSFVFVALQLRQNARHQRASVHMSRTALVQDLTLKISQLDDVNFYLRALAGDDTLEPAEVAVFLQLMTTTFRLFEEFFHQHRDGMLDGTRWNAQVRRIRAFMATRGMRAAWRALSPPFDLEFAAFMDAIVQETPLTTEPGGPVAAWKVLVKRDD